MTRTQSIFEIAGFVVIVGSSTSGQGFFTNPEYPAGSRATSMVAGDLNGNGQTDLAVVNFVADTVSVLLSNGDGTLQPPVSYPVPSGPRDMAIGDLDNDGDLDLVVGPSWFSSTLTVLLNDGNGMLPGTSARVA